MGITTCLIQRDIFYATMPQEIITGKDVVTPSRALTDPSTGEQVSDPGLQLKRGTIRI